MEKRKHPGKNDCGIQPALSRIVLQEGTLGIFLLSSTAKGGLV